jgi:hypothetical protein
MNSNILSQSDLILVAILNIKELKEECTFERLVYECFKTFPDKFSFYTYRLPDSLKLDRQLRKLRYMGYVKGNNTYGFELTQKGYKRATQLLPILSNNKKTINMSIKNVRSRKESRIIDSITSSDIFKKFNKGFGLKASLEDLRLLFFGTLETPVEKLINNIQYVQQIAEKAQVNSVKNFCISCKKLIKNIS